MASTISVTEPHVTLTISPVEVTTHAQNLKYYLKATITLIDRHTRSLMMKTEH